MSSVEHGVTPITSKGGPKSEAVLGVDTIDASRYPKPLGNIGRAIYGFHNPINEYHHNLVEHTKWHQEHWDITSELHQVRAGYALASGAPGIIRFGNFFAMLSDAHEESVRSVNKKKGRTIDQTSSVVTTREHIDSLFDWDKLPEGLTKVDVNSMMDAFYDKSDANPHAEFAGPFGFRGPAAAHIPDHLTSIDEETGIRTVQLIAADYDDLSNKVISIGLKAKKEIGGDDQPNYFAITSVNESSKSTGKDEPAHWLMRGVKQTFPNGFFLLGDRNQEREYETGSLYPKHEQNSTTIIDFSRTQDVDGRSAVYLARHGSLSDQDTTQVVNNVGLGLIIDASARPNLKLREYDDDFIREGWSKSSEEQILFVPRKRELRLVSYERADSSKK